MIYAANYTYSKLSFYEILKSNGCEEFQINKWELIYDSVNKNFQKRITHWIEFFDTLFYDAKSKHPLIIVPNLFKNCIAAFFNLITDEDWFSQTTYEFELSKQFLQIVLNTGNLTYLENDKEALYFLKTSLIFGYYPGCVRVSILKSSKLLLPIASIKNQSLFFAELFSSYKNSCNLVLYNNLVNMSLADVSIFMSIINGKSLRKLETNFPKYSKKQNHILLQELPVQLEILPSVFRYGWYFTKLLSINADENFFFNFYYGLKIDSRLSFLFIQDFDYWCATYTFFSNHEKELEAYNRDNRGNIGVRDLLDYLLHKKYTVLEPVSLKNRSIARLCETVQNWEFFTHNKINAPKEKIVWQPLPPKPWAYTNNKFSYIIEEISDNYRLFEETKNMHHCVYHYLEDCISKHIKIFSMHLEGNKNHKHAITIELRDKKVIQARGKYNRLPKKEELAVLKSWCKKQEYQIHLL